MRGRRKTLLLERPRLSRRKGHRVKLCVSVTCANLFLPLCASTLVCSFVQRVRLCEIKLFLPISDLSGELKDCV